MASEASAETRVKNAAAALLRRSPDRSMAKAVFSKVAGSGLSAIREISWRCEAKPTSTASA
ncbi:hypothetical protein D3C73_1315250 [compost metagenome]